VAVKIGREVELPLEHLHPNPNNPRHQAGNVSELAASIRAVGLLQPLVASKAPQFGPDHFLIEAGYRRWTAMRLAGFKTAPCRIRETTMGEDGAPKLINAVIENIHREDLTPMEKAWAFGQLRDEYGLTQTDISRRTGVNMASVSRYLTLLELTPASQDRVLSGKVTLDDAVHAVRASRSKNRKSQGKKPVDVGWDPPWFAKTHPLAKRAAIMCAARQHKSRRKLADSGACGQCFEQVIRDDQDIVRTASQAALDTPFIAPERSSVDPYLARQNGN
jgi:ParB family chromosome partitioning protein